MKVWSICASISVTITDIWTKFATENKYHTINTPEWPNLHKLEIQDCGSRHLEFWDSRLDIDLWTKVGGRYIAAMRRWPCDRKSKPEVNSHDVIKWMMGTKGCQSQWPWPIFEPNLVQRSNTVLLRWWNVPNSHNLKIQTGGGRHLECRKNVNNPGLDKDAYTKFGRKMHHNHAEMTTWPKVRTGSLFIWRHQMNAGNKRVSISVSITYIWTKFGTELNCHTF